MLTNIKSMAGRLIHEEEGATMVEYALMLALIAAICIGLVTTIGTNAKSAFGNIANATW